MIVYSRHSPERNCGDEFSGVVWKSKTIFRPASSLEPPLEGLLGSWGGFGQKFPEGGLNFLEVALVFKIFPCGNHPKQSSKKFASEPPKLLRSPFRSGPMRKLSQNRLKVRAKTWEKNCVKLSGHFRASFAAQSDPPNFSPNSSQFITPCLVAAK